MISPVQFPQPASADQHDAGNLQVLGPARLAQLVRGVAAAGEWQDLVTFRAGRRWFCRLELTENFEIWLLTWLPGQHTGFHDHGDASGAFAVVQGELQEKLARPGRHEVRSRTAWPGTVTSFGRQHLHDVANNSATPAVSIHAYSPPLTAMRRYDMTESGLTLVGTDVAEDGW
jgi:mannose-6-phosphate isomerase-like protein (cupin superfamily)